MLNKWKKTGRRAGFSPIKQGLPQHLLRQPHNTQGKSFPRLFPTGFAVRILLTAQSEKLTQAPSASHPHEQFVKKSRRGILLWCMEEIRKRPGIIRKIGSLDYYSPSGMVLLASNEIEVMFEVKEAT